MAQLFGELLVTDELEREEARRASRRLKRMIRDQTDPFQIPENEFINHFRLNKRAFQYLLEQLDPYMDGEHNSLRVPKMYWILAALNIFATGSYQKSVANNILACCSQAVVSRSIKEVANCIIRRLLKKWVRFPHNERERNALKQTFLRRHRMPEIIGVVDGTHVAIVKPRQNEHIYVNRKGYHSLNCQIICDARLRITNVAARWPGSTHDAYIWRQSTIGRTMRANFENGDNTLLMGDSGYSCLPWLLVPLANANTPQEEHFNNTF